MTMAAKVENYCIHKRSKVIYVDQGVRACVNCIWYEAHYRQSRGNVKAFAQLPTGSCLLHDCQRGALRQPCEDYETEKEPKQTD